MWTYSSTDQTGLTEINRMIIRVSMGWFEENVLTIYEVYNYHLFLWYIIWTCYFNMSKYLQFILQLKGCYYIVLSDWFKLVCVCRWQKERI